MGPYPFDNIWFDYRTPNVNQWPMLRTEEKRTSEDVSDCWFFLVDPDDDWFLMLRVESEGLHNYAWLYVQNLKCCEENKNSEQVTWNEQR